MNNSIYSDASGFIQYSFDFRVIRIGIIVEFKKAGLQADNIYADASGLGMVMCDALAEAGWEVNRVNFGSSAYDNDAYTNRSAEMWYGMAKKIGDAEIILPDDDELTAQLTCRRTITNSKGKLGVESKDSMRSRGLASPDKADALALCLDGGNMRFDLTFPVEKPTWRSLQALMESSDPVMAGFDAGGRNHEHLELDIFELDRNRYRRW